MKTGFKDPLAIKTQDRPDKPKDGKPDVFNFAAPSYDQRSSCFVNAGVNYGVGRTNPVGHSNGAKANADTLPFGRVDTEKLKPY